MGKYFEEFAVGDTFTTPGRTITTADIMNFAGVTGDFNPVHTDVEFARQTPFGEPIAHGPMLVGMAFGLLSRINLLDGTILALRNIEWRFEAPVKPGDTVHVVATVTQAKASRSDAGRGYLGFELAINNQHSKTVQNGQAGVIIMRKTAP